MKDYFQFMKELICASPPAAGAARRADQCLSRSRGQQDHRLSSLDRWNRVLETSWWYAVSMKRRFGPTDRIPLAGPWLEVFDSVCMRIGSILGRQAIEVASVAISEGKHGLPSAASIVIPANSMVVFARDHRVRGEAMCNYFLKYCT